MQVQFAYRGHSDFKHDRGRAGFNLLPNLARESVAFDSPLLHPLAFREAISALHDVVINDLRFKPRDKTAYVEWKRQEQRRLANVRSTAYKQATQEILARHAEVPPDLERRYERQRKKYWDARLEYSNYL